MPGIAPIDHARPPHARLGRATPEAYSNDALRKQLIDAAVEFTTSLPRKK